MKRILDVTIKRNGVLNESYYPIGEVRRISVVTHLWSPKINVYRVHGYDDKHVMSTKAVLADIYDFMNCFSEVEQE